MTRALILGLLVLCAGAAAQEPPDWAVLDAPLAGGMKSAAGPDGALAQPDQAAFEKTFLRITVPADGARKKLGALIASWPLGKFVDLAQGTVTFRVRLRDLADPKSRTVPALLRLTGTRGGEWTLSLRETPYEPPKPKSNVNPEEGPAITDVAGKAERKDGEARAGAFEAELNRATGKTPVSTWQCRVGLKIFAEGNFVRTFDAAAHVHEKNGWHRVVWTWRSVHHDLYIDGRRCGGATAGNTLSRMAPPTTATAVLQLLGADADVADLRVYNRFLDPPAAVAASKSSPAPVPPPFRVWADWAFSTGRTIVYADVAGLRDVARVDCSCVAVADGKVLKTAAMTRFPSGLGEQIVKVLEPDPFPPGAYRYDAVALDRAGREIVRARTADWTCARVDWPWLGFRGGLQSTKKVKIIPPYTPLVAEGDRISTVSVDHRIDRTGLFKSVAAGGGDLLAAPVRLDVYVGGKPLAFDAGPGLGRIDNHADAAAWRAESQSAAGDRLDVDGYMEYDGVTRFDVTLTPKTALKVDRIELKVPYRPDVVRLAHLGWWLWFAQMWRDKDGKWQTGRICWGGPKPHPRRPDVLFDSEDLYLSFFPPPSRYHYAPYVHVGNFHRGLSWFIINDRNWIHDYPKVPSMEFVARGDDTFLRLNVVARPAELDEPLHVRFYMIGNPFKPLPKDWRTWIVGDYQKSNAVATHTKHQFWWHWNDYARSFYPYPGGVQGRTYQNWLGKFKGDALYHTPFINFGSPGGFPLWNDETRVLPYSWKLHNNRPHQDYMMYWFDKCFREIGVRGVYIDEPYCEPMSYNVLAGDAPYIRRDGTRSIGFRYIETRDYIRRYKQLFTDLGVDYSVWIHDTNYRPMPLMTFADISMDGEHPSIWVPEFDNYHAFYQWERSRGYISGLPMGVVGTMMYHATTNPRGAEAWQRVHFKNRGYLAVTLPNAVLPMPMTFPVEFNRTQNIRYAFGVFDDGLVDLTTNETARWLPGARIMPSLRAVGGVLDPRRHRALLYLCGRSAEAGTRFEVEGGFGGLKLGKPHAHAWNAETGESLLVDGRVAFRLLPDDFGMMLVAGRDTPQVSRPAGAVLGVPFDKTVDPDFGGGIAAVSLSKAGAAPDLAGKALTVSPRHKAVGYPVVPSWVAGAVQLDVRLGPAGWAPLRLLALQHHLDVTLAYGKREQKPGLLLAAVEIPPDALEINPRTDPGIRRERFMPLPDAALDGWHRLLLSWRSGQYVLYLDGKPLGELTGPAAPRLRDAEAMPAGVWIGDGSQARGANAAAVDSLIVYNWAFDPEQARQAAALKPMAPAPRPAEGKDFAVHAWLKDKKTLAFSVNFDGRESMPLVSSVRVGLYNLGDLRKPISTAAVRPWQGVAWGTLALDAAGPKLPDAGAAALPGDDLGLEAPAEGKSFVKNWVLRVELVRTRKVDKRLETTVYGTKDLKLRADFLTLKLKTAP